MKDIGCTIVILGITFGIPISAVVLVLIVLVRAFTNS